MKSRKSTVNTHEKKSAATRLVETYHRMGFVYYGEPYTNAQEFGNRFKRLSIYKESELITTATSGV